MATTVLMYHAVCEDGGDADPHYTVTPAQFQRHLALVRAAALRPASVAQLRSGAVPASHPAFTFDDGHASNAWAAEALAQAGGAGDFFVNPSTIGRPGFLSWTALRDMAQAGMSIQSHGQHHRYLDELDDNGVMHELGDSKREIEDRLGRAVHIFAPPGGRMGRGFAALARQAGYSTICSSRVGVWHGGTNAGDVPRFAVLQSTGDTQWQRWMKQDTIEVLRATVRHRLLAAGKRALGNARYERLRRGLLRPHA